MGKITAVIPAAGQGKRMGNGFNKQFMTLRGMPIIAHTLRVFMAAGEVDDIILVCASGEEEYYRTEILPRYSLIKPVAIVTGGKERQDSVFCGLAAAAGDCEHILIHDGARPLVTGDIITRTVREVQRSSAVTVGIPVKDTIKKTDHQGIITETLLRDNLWHIQTPQAFSAELIMRAHGQARADGFTGTDDAALVERLGFPVKVITGSYENIKITTPEDIAVAETILYGRENH